VKNFNSGFTLIELLVVIAIIAILAAIAIPFYQENTIKARLVEVENVAAVVKSAVTAYNQEKVGEWPNCPTLDEVRNSLGVSVGSVSRISGISVLNGIISVTIQNIHSKVDGKTLTLTPTANGDGSVRWIWGWSSDFPTYLRPKS